MFSGGFIVTLIVAALALTAVSTVALLVLLFRDIVKGRLW